MGPRPFVAVAPPANPLLPRAEDWLYTRGGASEAIPPETLEDVDALVGPPMNYGASDMHAGYEGISYLNYRPLATVVRDVADPLAEGGFTDVVSVSGHLTND